MGKGGVTMAEIISLTEKMKGQIKVLESAQQQAANGGDFHAVNNISQTITGILRYLNDLD